VKKEVDVLFIENRTKLCPDCRDAKYRVSTLSNIGGLYCDPHKSVTHEVPSPGEGAKKSKALSNTC
jgi:hypothetical protein